MSAGIEETQWRPCSTPVRKFAGLAASRRGLSGVKDGGGQGLSLGTTGASFGVVNRPESKWEGMPSELVTDVRVTCRA